MTVLKAFMDHALWESCIEHAEDRPSNIRHYFSPGYSSAIRVLLSSELLRALV